MLWCFIHVCFLQVTTCGAPDARCLHFSSVISLSWMTQQIWDEKCEHRGVSARWEHQTIFKIVTWTKQTWTKHHTTPIWVCVCGDTQIVCKWGEEKLCLKTEKSMAPYWILGFLSSTEYWYRYSSLHSTSLHPRIWLTQIYVTNNQVGNYCLVGIGNVSNPFLNKIMDENLEVTPSVTGFPESTYAESRKTVVYPRIIKICCLPQL